MCKFCVLRAILKSTISKKNFEKSIIFKKKFFVLSDFESTSLQGVRIRIEHFRTCQILNVLLLQKFAKLSCVHENRARFGNVLKFGMGSANQVILLG